VPELVLDELGRVVKEKLGFSDERARAARELIGRLATERPSTPEHAGSVTGDATDDLILPSAVEASADVLVTGDRKHLLPLGDHRGVRVRTPQALLAELRE
jgi:predicted nucleic acid-binding protein